MGVAREMYGGEGEGGAGEGGRGRGRRRLRELNERENKR